MFAGRLAEAAVISVLATIVTAAIAAPVLRAPSERVFGMEIVGRHHDPFTVMQQFERPVTIGVYSQPVTDITGALLARLSGAVAAYNWLVLLSFPLSAAAAYLLARHLTLSPLSATVAAMAYAFSPFHLAHAAYHPHIAQTQWVPLYLLALWRCLDKSSPAAVGFLAAAAIAVTLSNFYAGMIVAVLSPVAMAAYWLFRSDVVQAFGPVRHGGPEGPHYTRMKATGMRQLGITAGSLVLIAALGTAYATYTAGEVVANRAAFAFPRSDLFRYSAKWWSYLIPPVEHPLFGAVAQRVWSAVGVREGLLEQQVSLGWGIIALGLVACVFWLRNRRFVSGPPSPPALPFVPVLVIVAVAALICSLSPERTIGAFTFVRPSALLYNVAPMFRSYARFGVVVQLMAALLAAIGVDALRRAGNTSVRGVCVALLALCAAEYAVRPSALWRDVLPTTAHRWIMRLPGRVQALDCTPLNQESESVQWLTGYRVTLLPGPGQSGSIPSCSDAHLSRALAANGYTHVLVRNQVHDGDGPSLADRPAPEGLRITARLADGVVFAVMEPTTASGPGEQP
jgi:hypothetical protein